ncbi:hypothetical protein [Consotaella salsifontis]|uniref:Uncharacterized protein n=1 Tax=Consotaella salsifontis TaxID=1365950 RepID=A0A1T4RYF4_9HYPH|nr:hypothetical protein [Consotaella salsifontis]SKA20947.1 hypothetical protein SAMN05428963_10882 [Consotaella salsifontis]
MTTVLRFLFVVPFGYIAACLAAAFALLWPFFNSQAASDADLFFWLQAGATFVAQVVMVGSATFVPWAAFMVLTELLGLSSLLLHAAAGALGAYLLTRLAYAGAMPDRNVITAVIVSGVAFALVYWVIAGRGAGSWRRVPPSRDEGTEPQAGEPSSQG